MDLSSLPLAYFRSLMALPSSPAQKQKALEAIAAVHSVVQIGSYCQTRTHHQLDAVAEAQVAVPAVAPGSVAAAQRSPSAYSVKHL